MTLFFIGFHSNAISATLSDMPDSIGGYSVLAVVTDAETPAAKSTPPTEGVVLPNRPPVVRQGCMRPGEKRLILQSPQLSIHDALHEFSKESILQELKALNMTEYAQWGWDIVGPGVTRNQLVKALKQSSRAGKAQACTTLGRPVHLWDPEHCTTISGSPGGEIKKTAPCRGFAIIQNGDPRPDINYIAQSVFLIAPTVGDQQQAWIACTPFCGLYGGYSAFLNNVVTDTGIFYKWSCILNATYPDQRVDR